MWQVLIFYLALDTLITLRHVDDVTKLMTHLSVLAKRSFRVISPRHGGPESRVYALDKC